MASASWARFIVPSLILMMMGNVGLNPVRGQISWTPIYVDTSNRLDLWTVSSTGCECPDRQSSNCACCIKPGGCLCPSNPHKCAQCGLESSCQKVCNATISARVVANRSGLSWVHLQSPELEGPTSCYWRLQSAPGQRIEVQIHRIISVGSFDNSTQTCKGGFLQFADGDTSIPSTQAIQLCGQNSRFSPPVVLFGDQGMATLYLRIEGNSTRSQVLAYVSFSSADDPAVGDPSRGGRLRPHSVCDWTYDNCWDTECIIASPGYPGLFPPHRRCRYFLSANATTDKILIQFQSLNIPPPPMCSSHHIAIWTKNVSNLAHLGPPWKTLCQQSNSTVEVRGGQALIEFRSGSTTSPNLYNGFRASVEFLRSPVRSSSPPQKKLIPTISPTTTTTVPVHGIKHSYSQPQNSIPKGKAATDRFKEKPLGNQRANTDDARPNKGNVVSCGHTFDGNVIREESFRLKIPKDLSTSLGKKNSKNSPMDALIAKRNSKGPFYCRLEFHGKSTDVVQLILSNYKLRDSNCSSTHIEVFELSSQGYHRSNSTTETFLFRLCGPGPSPSLPDNPTRRLVSTSNKIAIIVTLSSSTIPTGSEIVEGTFRFHDESIEGTLMPQLNCGGAFRGLTSSPSGYIRPSSPSTSPLMRLSPSDCVYSFYPDHNQSVLLTLLNATTTTNTGHDISSTRTNTSSSSWTGKYCQTSCSTSGCYCDSGLTGLEEIDHFSITVGSTLVACFCGEYHSMFPVVIEADKELVLTAHHVSFHNTKGGIGNNSSGGLMHNMNMTYAFVANKSRYTNFTISPPSGWKRWREIMPSPSFSASSHNAYKVYDLTWPANVPVRSKLSLDLLSDEYEKDCRTWNITVWAENDKLLDQRYLLSSFCPAEGRKEVKVPDSTRNTFIKLQGVSIRVPQFEIRWKYHDSSLSTRLPEKMMSDTGPANHAGHKDVVNSVVAGLSLLVITRLLNHLCTTPSTSRKNWI